MNGILISRSFIMLRATIHSALMMVESVWSVMEAAARSTHSAHTLKHRINESQLKGGATTLLTPRLAIACGVCARQFDTTHVAHRSTMASDELR